MSKTIAPTSTPTTIPFVAWADGSIEASKIMAETPDIYADIDERNGWKEPEEPNQDNLEADPQMTAMVGAALREVLTFALDVRKLTDKKCLDQVLMRFLCMVWLLRPELLQGSTLTSLATTLGVSRSHLSQIATLASRRWNFQSRVQRNALARASHSAAATKAWQGRKSEEG